MASGAAAPVLQVIVFVCQCFFIFIMPANTFLRISAFAVTSIDASVFAPGRDQFHDPLLGARIREVVLYFLESSGISRGYITRNTKRVEPLATTLAYNSKDSDRYAPGISLLMWICGSLIVISYELSKPCIILASSWRVSSNPVAALSP
ncbi:hypothetical protein F4808DRAFT_344874 [Astrocystis sublimbata]|nr:hypothetical protein F4808DRAFT_344874 [Astrocystis sublimbata]